jgi:arylsulfatase A-like enzyme
MSLKSRVFDTADGRPNILIIVSDTFRRDNMACYGGEPNRTPALNRFATEGTVFKRFYSCSFPTVPARADLLTGRIAFTRQGWGPLEQSWGTVAEVATESGYKTMCVTDVPFLMRSGFGYDRGFSDYIWVRGQPDRLHPDSAADVVGLRRTEADHCAPATMRLAAEWMERQAGRKRPTPFLLVADTWDPHEPWDAPPYYVREFSSEYEQQEVPYPAYAKLGAAGAAAEDVALGRAAYLGKTKMVDHWIGHLLGRLDVFGFRDNTVVFFLTDHGFYFGEHGYFGKSIGWRIGPVTEERSAVGEMGHSPLYEEVCHIPLVVRAPGIDPGEIDGMACIADVGATVRDIVGAEPLGEGRSLLAPEGTGLHAPRTFTVTSWPMHLPGERTRSVDSAERAFSGFMPMTVTTDRWSMLYSSGEDPVELYDLWHDPAQMTDVAEAHPEVVGELHGLLVSFLEDASCPAAYLAPRSVLPARFAATDGAVSGHDGLAVTPRGEDLVADG